MPCNDGSAPGLPESSGASVWKFRHASPAQSDPLILDHELCRYFGSPKMGSASVANEAVSADGDEEGDRIFGHCAMSWEDWVLAPAGAAIQTKKCLSSPKAQLASTPVPRQA